MTDTQIKNFTGHENSPGPTGAPINQPEKNKVLIYTTSLCGFCLAARSMLDEKNTDYLEIDVSDPKKRQLMIQHSKGARTVPQIFIHGVHIGGFDEMATLERAGKLDAMLKSSPPAESAIPPRDLEPPVGSSGRTGKRFLKKTKTAKTKGNGTEHG